MSNTTETNVHNFPAKEFDREFALGPGSVSWKLMRDPIVFQMGQLRTATVLMLHPPFAASAEHDTFLIDPLLRFRRVGMYTYSVTYGSVQDAERLSHMVRTRHGQVTGVEPTTRRPYQSNSEYELALTHVIQASSYLAIYEAINGPLPESDRDQYYQEQRVVSAMIGIHPDHLPRSNAEAETFLAEARKRYSVGKPGRDLLAYYDNKPYEAGTVLGDLPFFKRKLSLFAIRAFIDMALQTVCEEERHLMAINRRPKLRWNWLVRRSLKMVSSFMRSKRGASLWEDYLQKRAFGIYARAIALEDAPGYGDRKAAFEVPDPYPHYNELEDLKRNWPGDVADYALGREIEGELVMGEHQFVNLRDPSKHLDETIAS